MTRQTLSIGALFGLRLAYWEAEFIQQMVITPDLLFCGITKLQDLPHLIDLSKIDIEHSEQLLKEFGQLNEFFIEIGLNPRMFRRALRKSIGIGDVGQIDSDDLSLAPEAKEVIDRSIEIAREAGQEIAGIGQLLSALLEKGPTILIDNLLAEGIDVENFREKVSALKILEPVSKEGMDSETVANSVEIPQDKAPTLILILELSGKQKNIDIDKGRVVIGRRSDPGDESVIDLTPDNRVSRKHAVLYFMDDSWWVEHLSPKNKTFLNGTLLEAPAKVAPGDVLHLGETRIHIEHVVDREPGKIDLCRSEDEILVSENITENTKLRISHDVQRVVQTTDDPEKVIREFRNELRLAFPNADRHAVILSDGLVSITGNRKQPSYFSTTLAKRAIQTREAFRWIRDVNHEKGDSDASSLHGVQSAIYAPMVVGKGNEVLGVLQVETEKGDQVFLPEELDYLQELAAEMAGHLLELKHQMRINKIYVGHKGCDEKLVEAVKTNFRARGIRVLIGDDDKLPGDETERWIRSAVRSSDVCVYLFSEHGTDSASLLREIKIAEECGKRIIPVLTEPCTLPQEISGKDIINLYKEGLENTVAKVVDTLEKMDQPNYEHRFALRKDTIVKILFLASNPIDTTRLQIDQEIREIKQRIGMLGSTDKVDIRPEFAVRVQDLLTHILHHEPQVIHFSGHGNSKGEIILEDDGGRKKAVSAESLGELFRPFSGADPKVGIRCVVLNACWSSTQAKTIVEHIDCVVGMSRSVSDRAAKDFASGFYQALSKGRSLQQAFEIAKGNMSLEGLAEMDKPQLLAKSGIDPNKIYFVE
jgi:hypothetical protein